LTLVSGANCVLEVCNYPANSYQLSAVSRQLSAFSHQLSATIYSCRIPRCWIISHTMSFDPRSAANCVLEAATISANTQQLPKRSLAAITHGFLLATVGMDSCWLMAAS
jgi:TctA family transporter